MTPPPACPPLMPGVSASGARCVGFWWMGWRMAGGIVTDDALGPAEAAQ